MSTGETAEQMRDHWWWRPGWRVGRSFYTWHITFDDQPAAHQLADGYAPALDGLTTLDLIPPQWLHLTMQGVGFTDEVSRNHVAEIVRAGHKPAAAGWRRSRSPSAPRRSMRRRSSYLFTLASPLRGCAA